MSVCHLCGIPSDAGFFDDSGFAGPLRQGEEAVLASYALPRDYCGVLMYFAQFTDPDVIETPGWRWQIRCGGQPRDPYLAFERVINRWGLSGFPIHLRLEEGCRVDLVVRNVGGPQAIALNRVGGRIVGRYWYNTAYGGAPNRM